MQKVNLWSGILLFFSLPEKGFVQNTAKYHLRMCFSLHKLKKFAFSRLRFFPKFLHFRHTFHHNFFSS